VSDVVATILLLGLTVTLFGAIFAFVTRFPAPTPQDVNQFSATVLTNSSGITTLKILQLSGPTVPTYDHVFLQASRTVTNWQFSQPNGVPVGWGINNASTGWVTGQYWSTSFKPAIKLPTNITIYVLSTSSLLFSGVVPGYPANQPPVLTSAYTLPSPVAVKQAFTVYAVVSGNGTGLAVNISLSEIPGLASLGTPSMTYNATVGAWTYAVPSGDTTTNGTYLAFIQGTGPAGTVAGSVTVTITGTSSGGGGGGSTTLSATVMPAVQPPYSPATSSAPSIFLAAVINYTGTSTNVPVYVNFTVSQLEGGQSAKAYLNATLPGQTGERISGPEVLTIYSQTPYAGWLLNSTATLTAMINLQGVGKLSPTDTFLTANLVTGGVYITTSSAGAKSGSETTMSHSCSTSTSCPYLFINVSNAFSSTSVSVSGKVWSNATGSCGGCTSTSYTVSPTTVNAGQSLGINPLGSGTRYKPGGSIARGEQFTLAVGLTVTISGTTVGYIYATWVITLS
jgi:hypothetical protein